MSRRIAVWDPVVRIFHWSLVAGFAANAFYTRPGRDAHQTVGYVIAGLIALRLVWGLVGTTHARFGDFLPSLRGVLGQVSDMATGRRRVHVGHSPLGALMIYNLILTIAGIAATGYALTTVSFFGVEWVEEMHGALVTWAEVSIVLHVAAVIIESRRLGVNLPVSMVTGYKDIP